MGVVTLTACGNDAIEDANQPNYPSQTNNNDGGGMTTFSDTGDDGYQSFWDITKHWEMFYHYRNNTGDWGNPAMLDFKITPYVGLAYYDGFPDGMYENGSVGPPALEDFNIQPPGTYPNINEKS